MAGVFKSLDKSDVRITPFRTHKLWSEDIETTTPITNPNGYGLYTASISNVQYPYRHRKDGGSRIYGLDDANTIFSLQVSTNQILGATPQPIVRNINYLTGTNVYQQASGFQKSNQYIDDANYPNEFKILSYSTDFDTEYGFNTTTGLTTPTVPSDEVVNRIDYHGHSGGLGPVATIYISTNWRFMYVQLDANHQVSAFNTIINYSNQLSFMRFIAKGNTTGFVVAYDRPTQKYVLLATTNQSTLPTTVLASITPSFWNEDLRVKHLACNRATNTVFFITKSISNNDPSPLYTMASTGYSSTLNDNFVTVLSDISTWESFNFRSQTSQTIHGVTAQGLIYKNLVNNSGVLGYEVLDLRQYVGDGNEVIDAIITADNDSLQTPDVPRTITMLVKPITSTSGAHQLVTVNLSTNEVYDPIHLGAIPEGYFYGDAQAIPTFSLGVNNLVANGKTVLGVSGLSYLDVETGSEYAKLHTFNPNI